jgi:hypothetical protein
MGTPVDPRLVACQRSQADAFRRGAALMARPPQVVSIPYEDASLPGYLFLAGDDDTLRPAVILNGGYDGTAEELYFANGAAALARGYHVLVFDGPGQGAALLEQGMVLRPDWENVVTPVFDYLAAQPGVDSRRIALIGWSLGGYLAPGPRAASTGSRRASLTATRSAHGRCTTRDHSAGLITSCVDPDELGGNSVTPFLRSLYCQLRLHAQVAVGMPLMSELPVRDGTRLARR